jgi:hypothetical protein
LDDGIKQSQWFFFGTDSIKKRQHSFFDLRNLHDILLDLHFEPVEASVGGAADEGPVGNGIEDAEMTGAHKQRVARCHTGIEPYLRRIGLIFDVADLVGTQQAESLHSAGSVGA